MVDLIVWSPNLRVPLWSEVHVCAWQHRTLCGMQIPSRSNPATIFAWPASFSINMSDPCMKCVTRCLDDGPPSGKFAPENIAKPDNVKAWQRIDRTASAMFVEYVKDSDKSTAELARIAYTSAEALENERAKRNAT